MMNSEDEHTLSKEDDLLDITADLVSLDENHSFLLRLFSLNAGEWVNVFDASPDLVKIRERLQKLKVTSEATLYAVWLAYPEQDTGLGEDKFCIIIFFTDIDHWSTSAVLNKQYFAEMYDSIL